jgi:WD40 repeat protein/DNA-binding SARP family transcriptional activator
VGARLEFRILGPLEVRRDGAVVGVGGPRQRALLALLLCNANRVLSRDQLIDELLADQSARSLERMLRVQVSRLRKALADGEAQPRLIARAPGYLLRVEPGELDLERFEGLSREGRAALERGDAARAAELLRKAEELWRGRPLADLEFEPFARFEVQRLEELRQLALEDRVDAELALGRHGDLCAELATLTSEYPLRERLRAQLMLALYRSGRQADALAVYRQTSEMLRDELGLDPSRTLRELERSILEQDASLDRSAHVLLATGDEVPDVCPFKGLEFFEVSDAEYFCGRERLVGELLARAAESGLVGLIGPSGIGKSSLLRAGVLAAFARGGAPGSAGWRQVLLRPGERPHHQLTRALGGQQIDAVLGELSPGERLVIAVDQLEELLTSCEHEDERAAFLEQLCVAASDVQRRALVLVSLRGDHYASFVSYPRFAQLLSAQHVLVGPMDRGELAHAIVQPAARVGLEVERRLVDALVSDAAEQSGGLPLLSAMLVELWQARDGRALRYESYRASGGMHAAVARLAEAAYVRLAEPERRVARTVMLRLASERDGALVRRRAPVGELERIGGANPVVAALINARLLTLSDGRIELSHEALLHEWPRYRSWLDEDRAGRLLQAHLTAAAAEWELQGRDPGELYRGARFAAALEWRPGHEQELNPTERAFLDASRAAAGRAQRRLRMVLVGVAALLAVAVAAAIVALDQRGSARNQARVAAAQRLGVQALTGESLDRSLLLARQGVALDDSPATRSYLLDALLRSPAAIRVMRDDGNPLTALDLSPDGRTLAAGDKRGNVLFFDAVSGRPDGRPYATPSGGISAIRFSPDGVRLAVEGDDFVDIVDARTHEQRARLFAGPPSTSSLVNVPLVLGTIAFSPDSRVLAAGAIGNGPRRGAFIVRWDALTGRRLGPPLQVGTAAESGLVGFSSDGSQLVTSSSSDRDTVIRDAVSLRPVRSLGGGGTPAALSPDGRIVAFGRTDGSVRLLDLHTGILRVTADRHDGAVTDLNFTPDSRTLLTAGGDGRVIRWNVADARRIETFTGHAGSVSQITIAPDGNTAYSAGEDGTVIAWDLAGSRRLDQPFRAAPRSPIVFPPPLRGDNPTQLAPRGIPVPVAGLTVATTPGGGHFAVADDTGHVDVFDSRTFQRRRLPIRPGTQISAVALAPDGRTAAAITTNGHLRFANLNGRLGPLQPAYAREQDAAAWSLAFSRNGRWLATAGLPTPSLRLWDVNHRKIVSTSLLPPYAVAAAVAFSPDGTKLAAAAHDPEGTGAAIEILSVPQLAQLKTIRAPAAKSLEFSPDGRLLALGDDQGRVWIYDTRTWTPRGHPLIAHTSAIDTINISPDGRTLATTSTDGTTRLWDLASGRPLNATLPGLAQHDVAAAFVNNGNSLVTLYDNGQGYEWDIQPQSWARRACQIAGRTLTRSEWNNALPERTYAPACVAR